MDYYEELAEMYVGNDVSPDFYAWVFPKYDHVAVGTGTMRVNQAKIQETAGRYPGPRRQAVGRGRNHQGGSSPHSRTSPEPRRVVGRVALVGDAAGTVTKSSGEGIYFAAKSARNVRRNHCGTL